MRRKEETIVAEGSPCEGFFVVTKGLVRVYKIAPDGRERTLHIVRPPHSFAEAALFHAGGYPAFASAMEDSRLILVPREPFLRMLREDPESSVRMFESLSMWMHRLLDQLENETFLNARAKLASYVLRELRRRPAGADGRRVQLAAPKKEIASQLGMAPETFSRAQADLESSGLIAVSGRTIEVRDLAALEAVILGDNGE
ncbi:MAG TPA: Crp/Fnr family transcriptional regulator [Phycisphaerae bacterium]|nr:Crp/Fnr family transcriptional regulator [Phycisphaerae bacterium]HOJ73085.1 Crp/Fnr family transcriptional regulator [Phycisphaerae bacterium]HON67694.1 Crp/Fnr family transcriptional regulator [Phycisphaerae bacterium]HOQ87941.1 Crp/Fnr family transcriptional regulator [Phycisphaerae bacterium]HPU27438.1 Crp/Fnr family transcriptional regulator [Phycisphaerae bacterium]